MSLVHLPNEAVISEFTHATWAHGARAWPGSNVWRSADFEKSHYQCTYTRAERNSKSPVPQKYQSLHWKPLSCRSSDLSREKLGTSRSLALNPKTRWRTQGEREMSRETGRGDTQLKCWRRCPKSTPDKQRTSFIAVRSCLVTFGGLSSIKTPLNASNDPPREFILGPLP